jgi:hypothetical protein
MPDRVADDVRYWHFLDVTGAHLDVRFLRLKQTGCSITVDWRMGASGA